MNPNAEKRYSETISIDQWKAERILRIMDGEKLGGYDINTFRYELQRIISNAKKQNRGEDR
jgi:hypothetical protein